MCQPRCRPNEERVHSVHSQGFCHPKCMNGMVRKEDGMCDIVCKSHEERTAERPHCHPKPKEAGCAPGQEWFVPPPPHVAPGSVAIDHSQDGECKMACEPHEHRILHAKEPHQSGDCVRNAGAAGCLHHATDRWMNQEWVCPGMKDGKENGQFHRPATNEDTCTGGQCQRACSPWEFREQDMWKSNSWCQTKEGAEGCDHDHEWHNECCERKCQPNEERHHGMCQQKAGPAGCSQDQDWVKVPHEHCLPKCMKEEERNEWGQCNPKQGPAGCNRDQEWVCDKTKENQPGNENMNHCFCSERCDLHTPGYVRVGIQCHRPCYPDEERDEWGTCFLPALKSATPGPPAAGNDATANGQQTPPPCDLDSGAFYIQADHMDTPVCVPHCPTNTYLMSNVAGPPATMSLSCD